MAQFIEQLQYRIKSTSTSLSLLFFKVLSGLVIGLTMALIIDEILNSGVLAFSLVLVSTLGAFMKVAKGWTWGGVLMFDLFCVLVALLLRMYILVAPGA